MTVSHEEDPHVYRNALLRTAVAVLLAHMFLVAIHWGMVCVLIPLTTSRCMHTFTTHIALCY